MSHHDCIEKLKNIVTINVKNYNDLDDLQIALLNLIENKQIGYEYISFNSSE
jgi:hypothetical protein